MLNDEVWNKAGSPSTPFLNVLFFKALAESGCIGKKVGWNLKEYHSTEKNALLYTFSKTHSYGEFIFDWGWAEAYQRYGFDYYPKFTSMVPFTPVTTRHFLMPNYNEETAQILLIKFEEDYVKSNASSAHFLFLTNDEQDLFSKNGYIIRETIQYHFKNPGYATFEEYLQSMKSKKAKHIREERTYTDIQIRRSTGDELTEKYAERMYAYYISTIENKQSFDYLNENFFKLIFNTLKKNILFVEAFKNDDPIAGSLFFYDDEKLYGRYWGSLQRVQNLHFELCYYQGIEFAIENKLKVFEAGAQGEHKIARGFAPVAVMSAHKLKHEAFHKAVEDFIKKEKLQTHIIIQELSKGLPFKK